MERYICTLEAKGCEYKGSNGLCLMVKEGCGFRAKETEAKETKQKKWFEAYIKY